MQFLSSLIMSTNIAEGILIIVAYFWGGTVRRPERDRRPLLKTWASGRTALTITNNNKSID